MMVIIYYDKLLLWLSHHSLRYFAIVLLHLRTWTKLIPTLTVFQDPSPLSGYPYHSHPTSPPSFFFTFVSIISISVYNILYYKVFCLIGRIKYLFFQKHINRFGIYVGLGLYSYILTFWRVNTTLGEV